MSFLIEKKEVQTVFEYGSGGSTIFFSDRRVQCCSVEHDFNFFRNVYQQVNSDFVSVFCHPADSVEYVSGAIKEHKPENGWDLVLVDGRNRVKCFNEAVVHVRSGGWVVFDNFLRHRYLEAQAKAQDLVINKGWVCLPLFWFDKDEQGRDPQFHWHSFAFKKPLTE